MRVAEIGRAIADDASPPWLSAGLKSSLVYLRTLIAAEPREDLRDRLTRLAESSDAVQSRLVDPAVCHLLLCAPERPPIGGMLAALEWFTVRAKAEATAIGRTAGGIFTYHAQRIVAARNLYRGSHRRVAPRGQGTVPHTTKAAQNACADLWAAPDRGSRNQLRPRLSPYAQHIGGRIRRARRKDTSAASHQSPIFLRRRRATIKIAPSFR